MKSLASDNFSGVHPDILQAVIDANVGHEFAYGYDRYTEKAVEMFRERLGDVDVFFVSTGTGANVLGLKAIMRSYDAVLCPETAHINTNECGAVESIVGCHIIAIPTKDGKISVDDIRRYLHLLGNEHHAQPKVISISQPTELGTLYTTKEIKSLSEFAHKHGMYLHMDGARISNAAATMGMSFKEFTTDAGVDVLSFGGTKNGMMMGEAVIFFDRALSRNFKYIRKQGTQLASKMRFISAQFIAFLKDDLYLKNAAHANKMAKMLAEGIKDIPRIKIVQEVQTNAVFAIVPSEYIPKLQENYFFYVVDENISLVRWMCTFDTTEEDVKGFVSLLKSVVV